LASEKADRHEGRNFFLNVTEGALFVSGASFISAQTVLPALVARLGGDNVAVGAVGVIVWVGLFLPQIFAARYAQSVPWKKPWALWFGFAQRFLVLLIGIAIYLIGDRSPSFTLATFFILYALMQVIMGVTTPYWFDLFAKLTPVNRRGRLVGIRASIGGGVSFLCTIALTWLLGAFEFPTSYALAFLIAAAIQFVSIAVQWQLVEDHPSTVMKRTSMREYFLQLRDVFAVNREFKKFIVASAFLIIAAMPTGFFTVYALKRFQPMETIVGEFILTIVAVQIISALVNGFVADKYGNKAAIVLAATSMMLANVWALVASSIASFRLVFVFVGIHLGSELLARYNLSIEYGPTEQRSTYVGLMNTVLSPMYLFGLAGGWVSDRFGYDALFAIGILASLAGLGMMVLMVQDPRRMFAATSSQS